MPRDCLLHSTQVPKYLVFTPLDSLRGLPTYEVYIYNVADSHNPRFSQRDPTTYYSAY